MTIKKRTNPLPETFNSYDDAADFWDSHDTTEYLQDSHPVKVISEFRARHYEIEIDQKIAEAPRKDVSLKIQGGN